MRLTVMHNPTSGEQEWSRKALLSLLEKGGHEVRYQSTKDDDWESALDEPCDLVVAAGGDGTVRKTARRLAGRHIPFTIFPAGTANNIAKSLGFDGPPDELVASWSTFARGPLDIGLCQGWWGETWFLESVGVGAFAKLIAHSASSKKEKKRERRKSREKRINAGLTGLLEILEDYEPRRCTIRLDERDLSGDYLIIEALNMSSFGPHLELSRTADPQDGELDLVLVDERSRGEIQRYLKAKLNRKQATLDLEVHRGKRLVIATEGRNAFHIDDRIRPRGATKNSPRESNVVDVRLERTTLEVFAPLPAARD